jgi:flavin-dependent dehydrogenase
MRVAVVGGGPAGALLALHLARDGASVTVFDASHPREKPCGGGVTAKALALLPPSPEGDPIPGRRVTACRFESGEGDAVDVSLARPVIVASRLELDAWLLRQAVAAGARHVSERVTAVAKGSVTAGGIMHSCDLVVGADGAGSLVRRTFLSPTPPARLTMAAGWFARGASPMLVRFTPGLAGYLWLFPRPDHVGVGICAPLAAVPTRELIARLEHEVARAFPALTDEEAGRYAHTIPSPSSDPSSIAEIAGDGWALVGDAGALADPITGEGIYYALRSARLLADTLREDGSPRRYPERALADFGHDLLKAAALHARFFAPGFAGRMIRYASRSRAIRGVLGDLVLGDQGYVGLKRRLVRTAPRFAVEMAGTALRARGALSAGSGGRR